MRFPSPHYRYIFVCLIPTDKICKDAINSFPVTCNRAKRISHCVGACRHQRKPDFVFFTETDRTTACCWFTDVYSCLPMLLKRNMQSWRLWRQTMRSKTLPLNWLGWAEPKKQYCFRKMSLVVSKLCQNQNNRFTKDSKTSYACAHFLSDLVVKRNCNDDFFQAQHTSSKSANQAMQCQCDLLRLFRSHSIADWEKSKLSRRSCFFSSDVFSTNLRFFLQPVWL